MVRHGRRVVNGKVFQGKKPLYVVHAEAAVSKIEMLGQRLRLNCERKRKLLEFLAAVKDLPSSLRYELLTRYFKKERGKWLPIGDLPLQTLQPPQKKRHFRKRPSRRRQRGAFIVKCPKCGDRGTLTLHREENGERTLLKISVAHEEKVCELDAVDVIGKGENGGTLVACKCGRPGYIYVSNERYVTRGKYSYAYLRVKVCHHIGKRCECCTLIRMEPLEDVRQSVEQNPTRASLAS